MPKRVIDGVAELRSLIGREVGLSDWFTISQERINAFAAVTEDRQWIHCDVERALAESPYGATISHGYLTLSLVSHLFSQAVLINGPFSHIVNYGINRVRFPAPVFAGARIRARCSLQAVDEVDGGLQTVWLVTIDCEGQPKPAMVAETLCRCYWDANGPYLSGPSSLI